MQAFVGDPARSPSRCRRYLDAGLDGITISMPDVYDLEAVALAGETLGAVIGTRTAVTPEEVRRIAAIRSPVLRNLEITYAYSLLAADVARRSGQGANWCTFATWASRQAGRDDPRRGRDRLPAGPARRATRAAAPAAVVRALAAAARAVRPRLAARAADGAAAHAVRRGRAGQRRRRARQPKVFEEIGYEFARYLERRTRRVPRRAARGRPADGQRCCARVHALRPTPNDPARSELLLLRQPRDRPARADAPAAGDPRGARRARTSPPRSSAGGCAAGAAPAAAARRRRARRAGPGRARRARARADHPLADGALGAGPHPRARARTSTTRTRRRCASSSNAELAALIARFEPSRPRPTTAARATGRTSTSGCTTSSTSSAPSTRSADLLRRAVHAGAGRAVPRGVDPGRATSSAGARRRSAGSAPTRPRLTAGGGRSRRRAAPGSSGPALMAAR